MMNCSLLTPSGAGSGLQTGNRVLECDVLPLLDLSPLTHTWALPGHLPPLPEDLVPAAKSRQVEGERRSWSAAL